MENSIQDNSPYSDGIAISYSGLNSQDRYLMSGNNSAFSTAPSSRNSFEMSSGGNQRQTIVSQVIGARKVPWLKHSAWLHIPRFSFLPSIEAQLSYFTLHAQISWWLKGMMNQASSRPLSPDDAAPQYYGSNSGFQSGASEGCSY